MALGSGSMVITGGSVDVKITNAAGGIIRDTKAERIADHTSTLDVVVPKIGGSATLRGMLDSYSSAVSDPADELVHLYEIRDALSRHYGGETPTRDALGITKADWQRLGSLASAEPLEQGRHRGRHTGGLRSATSEELKEARALVRKWIVAFAQVV